MQWISPPQRVGSRVYPLQICALSLLLAAPGIAQEVPEKFAQNWDNAASLLVAEANAGFEKLAAAETDSSREVRFGEAITLLSVNPKTEANMERADAMLADLALVKLAIMQLVAETDTDLVKQRVATFQDQVSTLTFPPAQRDLCLLLSDVQETQNAPNDWPEPSPERPAVTIMV